MKTILTTFLILGLCATAQVKPSNLAGSWQMSVKTPHGDVPGTLKIQQDGAKISGTCELDQFGSGAMTGSVEGKAITFTLGLHDGQLKLEFKGNVDGDKMSGSANMPGQPEANAGAWSATKKQSSAHATPTPTAMPAKSIVGTVTGFKPGTHQLGVRPDGGAPMLVQFGVEMEVVSVLVGERDLKKAAPSKVSDVVAGDRVLVSFVDGMAEARRILVMPASEIARRDEKDRQDWRERGVSGMVSATNGNEVAIGGVTLVVTDQTVFRRYSSDTVKFSDAKPSTLAALEKGDQVRARGTKSADGTKLIAEEVVSGKFVSRPGTITAANSEKGEITIQDSATKASVIVRITADSKLKLMPDMATLMHRMEGGAEGAARRVDMTQMMEELQPAKFDDLTVGSGVMVTSAKGGSDDSITAITLLAKADLLLKMMQPAGTHAGDADVEAMRKMHGISGSHAPTVMSMPAFVQ